MKESYLDCSAALAYSRRTQPVVGTWPSVAGDLDSHTAAVLNPDGFEICPSWLQGRIVFQRPPDCGRQICKQLLFVVLPVVGKPAPLYQRSPSGGILDWSPTTEF